MEQRLYLAVEKGDVEEVKEILRSHPHLSGTWKNEQFHGATALQLACLKGHLSIVSVLLAHPPIDVNLKDREGWTPFMSATIYGYAPACRLLLRDYRVQVNEPGRDGSTPLFWAATMGRLDTIRRWIASGREMDLGQSGDEKTDAIGKAKAMNKKELGSLLERFKENPEEVRHALRMELCWYDEAAAEVYALVVFVSDGLLQVTQGDQSTPIPAARLFSIATQLPLELQMVLCHRLVGSSREIIPAMESEMAFKHLAKKI